MALVPAGLCGPVRAGGKPCGETSPESCVRGIMRCRAGKVNSKIVKCNNTALRGGGGDLTRERIEREADNGMVFRNAVYKPSLVRAMISPFTESGRSSKYAQ